MLKLHETKRDTVSFITSLDEAILEGSDWTAYRESLDEQHLRLSGEPTRFLVRSITQAMQNSAVDYSGGTMLFNEALQNGTVPISYMREVCRYAVAGVENPDDGWPKPAIVRERGYTILSREVLDSLPDLVCIEIAALSRELESSGERLKKK